jgi:hypothetical protein
MALAFGESAGAGSSEEDATPLRDMNSQGSAAAFEFFTKSVMSANESYIP